MSTTQQPEALRLADALERPGYGWHSTPAQCAAELRRLHAENESLRAERERNLHSIRVNNEIINKKLDENETLRAGYAAARLEIESLRARVGGAPAGEYPALPEIKDMHNGPQQLNLSDRAMWVLGWNECRDAIRDADRAMRAAQPAPAAVVGPADPSITLDFKQATELLEMFGGEPGLVTLQHGNERSHSGAGLYAWYSDIPEEGAEFLGAEPDDEATPTTQPAHRLPERDASIPAEQQGLFRKFDVRRVDGSDQPGGKHHGCTYFVLDLDHDPHARQALVAYAAACESTHPTLSADLRTKWGAVPTTQPAPQQEPIKKGGEA